MTALARRPHRRRVVEDPLAAPATRDTAAPERRTVGREPLILHLVAQHTDPTGHRRPLDNGAIREAVERLLNGG